MRTIGLDTRILSPVNSSAMRTPRVWPFSTMKSKSNARCPWWVSYRRPEQWCISSHSYRLTSDLHWRRTRIWTRAIECTPSMVNTPAAVIGHLIIILWSWTWPPRMRTIKLSFRRNTMLAMLIRCRICFLQIGTIWLSAYKMISTVLWWVLSISTTPNRMQQAANVIINAVEGSFAISRPHERKIPMHVIPFHRLLDLFFCHCSCPPFIFAIDFLDKSQSVLHL